MSLGTPPAKTQKTHVTRHSTPSFPHLEHWRKIIGPRAKRCSKRSLSKYMDRQDELKRATQDKKRRIWSDGSGKNRGERGRKIERLEPPEPWKGKEPLWANRYWECAVVGLSSRRRGAAFFSHEG